MTATTATTTTTNLPTVKGSDTASQASAHANVYFAADNALKEWRKTSEGARITALEADKKNALDALAKLYPAEPVHADAQHRITVFGKGVQAGTVTFLHREDTTTAWKDVLTHLLPDLTREQVARVDFLKGFHVGRRKTKKFM